MKIRTIATVVAGALCFGLSLPVYAANATDSKLIVDKIGHSATIITDEAFPEKSIQQDQISDQISGEVRLSPIDERILENSSPIVYVLANAELGEPVQKPETGQEIDKEADGELGDPLQKPEDSTEPNEEKPSEPIQKPDNEESDNELGKPIQKPDSEESAEPEVTEEPPAPAPGGESERIAYVQIIRYYFGMTERSLEEYAEYLRTEEGWDNEEWLQHILSLAFPDEYAPLEPQPVPDDELEIVY